MPVHDLFGISESKFDKGNLDGKFKFSWVEQSFDVEEQNNKKISVSHTRNYLGISISKGKINNLFLIVILGLLLIFSRIFYLQAVRGSYYRSLAENNRIRLLPIPAERGIIYDRYHKELVQNVPSFTLSLVPQDLPRDPIKKEIVLSQASAMSGVPLETIKKNLSKYNAYGYLSMIIKEDLDYDTALRLYVQNSDLPGVSIQSGTKRRYLNSEQTNSESTLSISHLLGYLGKLNDVEAEELKVAGYLLSDTIGRAGIEKTHEKILRGVTGRKKIEVNALGREQNILAVEPPIPGKNIILSLDLEAQNKLEHLVKNALESMKKNRAAAIAMNPQTGAILAMVSWPTFDNNKFSGGISSSTYAQYVSDPNHPLFNRAIGGTYPPGSTIKPIISAAALEEGIITKNTVFNSTGGLRVDRWFFKDWKVGGHGWTNVTKAIAWSINTFFYYIGGGYKDFVGLGADKLLHYLTLFNLGKKTGIDLPGERNGFLPSKEWKLKQKGENWFVGDTYNLSIGQGDILVTPLQVALWTSEVANDGKKIEPHLAETLTDPITKITTQFSHPTASLKAASSKNLAIVRQGMAECVKSGSCQLLKTLPFATAGKTGTAQWNSSRSTHAWFTAFAPFDNPELIVTVLVEEGGEGGSAALPIARDFLSWWGKKYLTRKNNVIQF